MIFGLRELEQRRAGLVERCAELRMALVDAAAPIGTKVAAADRILTAVRVHPIALTVAAGVVAGLVPRLLPRWLSRALLLYSLLKRV